MWNEGDVGDLRRGPGTLLKLGVPNASRSRKPSSPNTMQVRLHPRLIRVVASVVDNIDQLVVTLASTVNLSEFAVHGEE